MRAIDLRVREETLNLAGALVLQRGLERAALLREALEVGLLLIAASGPPAASGAADTYGTLAAVRLAQLLRPRLAPILDFLNHYGALPQLSAFAAASTLTPPPPADLRPVGGIVAVDPTIQDTLDSFGIDALGER
jgi:hypothetical protein